MEDLLGSKTAIKILNVLFNNPSQEFKEISLISSADTGKGSASTFIEHLIKEKLVISKRVGKTKIIKLNLSNETALLLKFSFGSKRLQKLPKDVLASIELLRDKVKENVSLIIVFGSYIAGTATEESDIDLLIAAENPRKIEEKRKEVEEIFGKRINLHMFNKTEIFKQDNFVKNALISGIVIYGYDFAISLLKEQKKELLGKIEHLLGRCNDAFRNYNNKDYQAANFVVENIIEQIIFLILSKKNIQYISKKDAFDSIKKLPEGRIIENIKKISGRQKIEQLEMFLKELYAGCITGGIYD